MQTPLGINFSGLLHLLLREEEKRNKINSKVQILSGKGIFLLLFAVMGVFFVVFVLFFPV